MERIQAKKGRDRKDPGRALFHLFNGGVAPPLDQAPMLLVIASTTASEEVALTSTSSPSFL